MNLPVMRAAVEEIGLSSLHLVGFLGENEHRVPSLREIGQGWCYYLVCDAVPSGNGFTRSDSSTARAPW